MLISTTLTKSQKGVLGLAIFKLVIVPNMEINLEIILD